MEERIKLYDSSQVSLSSVLLTATAAVDSSFVVRK